MAAKHGLQLKVPAGVTSSCTIRGSVGGCGALTLGISRLTECSWIGIVMMSMTSSTSSTSTSGVVLMSAITSASSWSLPSGIMAAAP